jgi:putative effector of murein hydrolase LrgA (UPF0299 family)
MLLGLFSLLACQLAGEAIAHGLHVPVPGPVIGILLLVAILAIRHRMTARDATDAAMPLGMTSDALLRNLGLLFVPAGAGIIQSIGLVASNGVAVGVALAGSTIITLIATVATFRLVSRAIGRDTSGDRA